MLTLVLLCAVTSFLSFSADVLLEKLEEPNGSFVEELDLLRKDVNQLQSYTKQLKNENQELAAANVQLRLKYELLDSRIDTEIQTIKEDNQQLHSENYWQGRLIEHLHNETLKLQTISQMQKIRIAEYHELDNRRKELKKQQKLTDPRLTDKTMSHAPLDGVFGSEGNRFGRPGDITDTVAFSVKPDADVAYDDNERILFKIVEHDTGNFSIDNSRFTCPTTGLYYFNVNIYFQLDSTRDHRGWVEVVRSGSNVDVITQVKVFATDVHMFNLASNSVITMCSAGDIVYARSAQPSYVGHKWTSFNGLLLAKE